jgi:hypothetical protein
MGQLSPILRNAVDADGRQHLHFWCPGCNEVHGVVIGENGWTWNGDAEKPTFQPSVLVTSGHYSPGFPHGGPPDCACNYQERFPDRGPWPWPCSRCHSFVAEGQIQFLGDCTHELANQTVPLPAWSEGA